MGTCHYCDESAGVFSSEHKECKTKHDQGPSLLAKWADQALSGQLTLQAFETRLNSTRQSHHLNQDEVRQVIAVAMAKAAERFLQDGLLTEDEEALLGAMQRLAGITTEQLGTKEFVRCWSQYGFSRWEYAALLRDTVFTPKESLEARRKLGKFLAESSDFGPALPFRLAGDEFLGNIEDNVVYYKTKTVRSFVGSTQGVSVRVGPGVYYRLGSFKGRPIEESHLQRMDMGRLAYSNRALYFWGESQRLRLTYSQILSWEPAEDCITIWRTRENATPEVFRGDAGFGWYMANVFQNYQLMDRDGRSNEPAP
jgi:hypothetical protein